MQIAIYFTAIWFLLTMIGWGLVKYNKLPFIRLDQPHHKLFVTLEALTLVIAICFHKQANPSPLAITVSIFLLLIGWINSHQNLLFWFFNGTQRRLLLQRINLFFEGSSYTQNVYFVGDWFQIVAIALIWNSIISLAICCIIYPTLVFILSEIRTRSIKKTDKEFVHMKNEAWRYVVSFVLRGAIAILIPIGLFAILHRDWAIFFGTVQDATNLITTLAQVETTVFALVITFLFLLVEFTNSAYSPRLVKSFVRHWSFVQMVCCAFLSITTKFLLIANMARFVKLGSIPSTSEVVDWALLITILSILSYIIFIRAVIDLMQPETIVHEILSKFDNEWMEIVRRNWSEKNRLETLSLSDDPMILFERYLSTAIQRADFYSTKIALFMMKERISRIVGKDDGAIIDNYLFNRIGNVIGALAQSRSDAGLEILCDEISTIVTPSPEVIKNDDSGHVSFSRRKSILDENCRKRYRF